MGTQVNILNYTNDFKCSGSACKNTCCQYWDVNIDKDTFEKYNKVENIKLREYIKSNITKNVVDATYKDYAKAKLDKRSKKCAFLNTNNLCTIQKRLGADYLSLVCKVFPRKYNRFPDMMECSLSLSCEEACRLALTSEDPMKVLSTDNKQTQTVLLTFDIPSQEKSAAIKSVRAYLFKVMDSSDYNMAQKLFIIGILVQALKESPATDMYGNEIITPDYLAEQIAEQSILLENKAFDLTDYFGHAEKFIADNINLIKEVLNFKPTYYTYTYNNYRSILFNFINYDEKNHSLSFDISRYHNTCNSFNADFMEHNSYLLENYINNYVYQSIFPFRDIKEDSDIFQEYLILIFNYFMIKMHLLSLLYSKGSLDRNDVVDLISCFYRNYENHFAYEEFVLSLCEQNGINNVYEASKLLG